MPILEINGQRVEVDDAPAVDRVREALTCFERVREPGYEIYFAIAGVRKIIDAALDRPHLPVTVAPMFPHAVITLCAAASVVADASISLSPEQIYFGIGSVSGLLTVPDDGYRNDRFNYAGIFVGQLTVELHRQALKKRGFPMLRAIQIQRAWGAERNPCDPVQ